MPHRDRSRRLKELVQVRDLQRLRAEGEAARAALEAKTRHAMLDESELARDASAERWRMAMSESAVMTELAALWSNDLKRRECDVGEAVRAKETADAQRARRARDYDAALARRDAIKELARKAEKADARKQDDAALQDALDQGTLRRRT